MKPAVPAPISVVCRGAHGAHVGAALAESLLIPEASVPTDQEHCAHQHLRGHWYLGLSMLVAADLGKGTAPVVVKTEL